MKKQDLNAGDIVSFNNPFGDRDYGVVFKSNGGCTIMSPIASLEILNDDVLKEWDVKHLEDNEVDENLMNELRTVSKNAKAFEETFNTFVDDLDGA